MSYTSQERQKASSEGKAYTYQTPTETAAPAALAEDKQKFMSAVSELIDALSAAASNGAPAATNPAPAPPPNVQPPPSVQPAPNVQPPAAGGPTGTASAGGAAPNTGYAPPGGGTTGAIERPGGGEAVTTAGTSNGATQSTEATVVVQREQYRMDREREVARKVARAKESGAAMPGGNGAPGMSLPANKHMSDSNRAPLTEARAFNPSFGSEGKGNAPTMEKMALPSHRPETVPAPGVIQIGGPIDAYWGSFGTAVERAAVRASKSQTQSQFEVIIGTDDRVEVTNTQAYPWRCICSLLITAQSGTQYVGTGWLVSPRLVLTAGHCVHMADDGGWAASIEVSPGRRGSARPYGSVVSREMRSVTGWTRDHDSEFDYGAIILPADTRYGDQLGWFGFASRTDDHLRNVTLNLSGYPGDGGPRHLPNTQWWHSRQIQNVLERELTYQIDTFGGQSGSPVWELASDGGRYGVGIHTHGATVSNGATRITRDVFDNIMAWAGQAP